MEKLCSECKWHKTPKIPIMEDDPSYRVLICTHENSKRITTIERSEEGTCGPDGIWWESV